MKRHWNRLRSLAINALCLSLFAGGCSTSDDGVDGADAVGDESGFGDAATDAPADVAVDAELDADAGDLIAEVFDGTPADAANETDTTPVDAADVADVADEPDSPPIDTSDEPDAPDLADDVPETDTPADLPPADTGPDWPDEPWFELGTGEFEFVPVVDGDEVMMVQGIQGGFHLWGAFRGQGFAAVEASVEIYGHVGEGDAPVAGVAWTNDLEEVGGLLRTAGITIFVAGAIIPELADGEEWRVCGTLRSLDGITLEDCMNVVVRCCDYLDEG